MSFPKIDLPVGRWKFFAKFKKMRVQKAANVPVWRPQAHKSLYPAEAKSEDSEKFRFEWLNYFTEHLLNELLNMYGEQVTERSV